MESAAGRTALTGFAALAVAMGVGRFAFTPILPMMQDDAGITLAQGSWLASANYVGYLLGALWAAATPLRSAAAIRGGLVAIAVSTAAMGLSDAFAFWLALRTLAGVASAWVLIHVSSWCLARLAAAERASLGGLVYAGVGAGVALAGAACLALMSLRAHAADAWLLLGAVSVVVLALLWPAVADARETLAPARAAAWRSVPALKLVVCYGAYGLGYIIPATFLPVMAREAIPNPALFGWAWPVFGLAAAASTLAASRLAGRIGDRGLWLAAQLVLALGVAAPLLLDGLAGIALAALCVGGTFVTITMAGMQVARGMLGEQAAPLMAAMTAAFAAGQIAGPVAASLVVAAGGTLGHALAGTAVLLVASAFLLMGRTD